MLAGKEKIKMNLYTWGGIYFGKRDGDNLWTHDGRHVGNFRGDELFDKNGRYIGQLKSGKLITCTSKLSKASSSFSPYASRVGHVPSVNHVGTVMIVGYEDFPSPEEL
jgi:hypothetical protein